MGSLGAPVLDPGVLIFALAVALGATLLALVPAFAASRPELVTAPKEDDRGGGHGGRTLSILVVSEVANRANAPGVGRHYISSDYFRALGIPILAGRPLTAADRAARRWRS